MNGSKEMFLEERQHEVGLPEIFKQQPTKSSIPVLVKQIVEKVDEGNIDAAELAVMISYAENVFDELKKQIRENVTSAIPKEGLKKFGAALENIESAVKYSFENCGDNDWQQWDAAERSAKESKKEREKFLKTLTKSMTIVNEQTGEIETINPPVKSSLSTYKVTLGK